MKLYTVAYKFKTELEHYNYTCDEASHPFIKWLDNYGTSNIIEIGDASNARGDEFIEVSFSLKKDAIACAKAFDLPVQGPYMFNDVNPWENPYTGQIYFDYDYEN
jgi:hypothetical protein